MLFQAGYVACQGSCLPVVRLPLTTFSPGMICRFGDMIGDSTLEALQAFEKNNWARLSRDGIRWGLVEQEDLGMYFMRKVNVMKGTGNYPCTA